MLKKNLVLTPLFIMLFACSGNESTTNATTSNSENNIPTKEETNIGDVLATVNGIAIGSNDYQKIASRTSPSDGKGLDADEKRTVLNNMVEEELLFQEAYNRGLYRDPKVRKVMINALLREEVYSQVRNSDFSDTELQAYFDEHSSEFTIPEKVQFSRILIKVTTDRPDADAKSEAERIYNELKKNPANFREVATKISEGPYRRRGGDVGFVPRDGKPGLDEVIVEKAFTMKKGQLTEPFLTKDGYNVIYIKENREAIPRTFQQMKGSVLRKLKNQKLENMKNDYVGNLTSKATVETKDEQLQSIEVKASARPSLSSPKQFQKSKTDLKSKLSE
jgi:parvulin-like peptidyl-prolyl isomerase